MSTEIGKHATSAILSLVSYAAESQHHVARATSAILLSVYACSQCNVNLHIEMKSGSPRISHFSTCGSRDRVGSGKREFPCFYAPEIWRSQNRRWNLANTISALIAFREFRVYFPCFRKTASSIIQSASKRQERRAIRGGILRMQFSYILPPNISARTWRRNEMTAN